ncbi:MAG: MBL fold metallo-hydrolase [Rhodothermales bacterium]
MSVKYVALGATDVIGASCHYLDIDGTGIVLDAGSDPEEEGMASVPRLDLIADHPDRHIDHALITHAHHDHLGSVPVLIRMFPHVQVHMTKVTQQLADLLLPASARLQRRRLMEGSSDASPLFDEEELEMQSYVHLGHDYEQRFDVSGVRAKVPVEATFYDAGHVLGSAAVMLSYETADDETRRIFYTSDINLRSQTIIPAASLPEEPIDVLMLETTLGADSEAELTTRRSEEKRLGESIARVLDRGGTVLIPVFALGRAQEVLALIGRYKDRGIISDRIPVYTAGSMRAIADVYDKSRYATPRLNNEFEVFGVSQRRLPRSNQRTREALREPSIHIVASGMMFERTISNRLAQVVVEDEKSAIFLVGYTRDDAPAGALVAAAAEDGPDVEVTLDKLVGPQPLKCEVDRFRFSGHSHRRDLIQLVEKLQPKKVLLVHGESEAREWMADNIGFFYPDVEVLSSELGEEIEIL